MGGKESGIKDFDPGHSSFPLIDLIACFLVITVSESGSYCQPLEVSQESYSHVGPTLASLSGTHAMPVFWAAACFSIHRNPLDGLGFRLPIADMFSSRSGSS